MTSVGVTENVVEETFPTWLESLGYEVKSGPDIAPGEPAVERDSYFDSLLREVT